MIMTKGSGNAIPQALVSEAPPPVSLPLALARTTFLSAPLIAGRRVDLRLIPHRAPERTMGLSAIQAAEKRREGKAFFLQFLHIIYSNLFELYNKIC